MIRAGKRWSSSDEEAMIIRRNQSCCTAPLCRTRCHDSCRQPPGGASSDKGLSVSERIPISYLRRVQQSSSM